MNTNTQVLKFFFIMFSLYHSILVFSINNSDLVIFSFDRAMQLYALLESTEKYIKGLNDIFVLYRVSNKLHDKSYLEIQKRFKNLNIKMIKQGLKPKSDFKQLLFGIIKNSKTPGIMFAVDDNIVTDFIDLNDCWLAINSIKDIPIFGFYLRLGKNITYSNVRDIFSSPLPEVNNMANDMFYWSFNSGGIYWKYPNSLDMVLYKKNDILLEIFSLKFSSPNTLEGKWASSFKKTSQFGLCYDHSKVINIPANLVQKDWKNPNMSYFSIQNLLEKFQQGYKIDISKFYKIDNKCPHHEEIYTFIKR